ncbi:hypothetical protein MiSe_53360 [Microseira wollei NIES-4236]|uniref:Uncharacterized protein n=1 Tax=Microseira wollei NIES-4236 TaxID=2530354 RepID=A0AAV3XLX2_9CYAN|nr:hypothetical protein MiSe_53360 [Microseira wollei NIES-4236]
MPMPQESLLLVGWGDEQDAHATRVIVACGVGG